MGQSDQAKAEYRWQSETKRGTRAQSSASRLLYLSKAHGVYPLSLQVTHTLHVDAMACVENGWQTSNGGAVQEDQDCTIDSSGDQTRALKAQRRGRGRGVGGQLLGTAEGLHLAFSLENATALHGGPWHCFTPVQGADSTKRLDACHGVSVR